MVFFVVNCHMQPLLGILQGFGAPSCAKILTSWFAAKERGTYWVSKHDFRCDSIFSIYSYARSACRACGILPTILEVLPHQYLQALLLAHLDGAWVSCLSEMLLFCSWNVFSSKSGACGLRESSPSLSGHWSCWHWKTRLKREDSPRWSKLLVVHLQTSFYFAHVYHISHELSAWSQWIWNWNHARNLGVLFISPGLQLYSHRKPFFNEGGKFKPAR